MSQKKFGYHSTFIGTILLVIVGTLIPLTPTHAETVTTTFLGITYSIDSGNPEAGAKVVSYDSTHGNKVSIPSTINIGGSDYPVTVIGYQAFHQKRVKEVTIPNSVKIIESQAFFMSGLSGEVTIPDSVTKIYEHAFRRNNISKLNLSKSITKIGDLAFAENSLSSLVIPPSLTEIQYGVFVQNKLTEIILPETLEGIGMRAFADNYSLRTITIPASVKYLVKQAFQSTGLTHIWFNGNAPKILGINLGSVFGENNGQIINVRSAASGFTFPIWEGYHTQIGIYQIVFDTGEGEIIAPVTRRYGEILSEPANPTLDGHVFTGWFTISDGTLNPYDFATPITADITLYAGWKNIVIPAEPDIPEEEDTEVIEPVFDSEPAEPAVEPEEPEDVPWDTIVTPDLEEPNFDAEESVDNSVDNSVESEVNQAKPATSPEDFPIEAPVKNDPLPTLVENPVSSSTVGTNQASRFTTPISPQAAEPSVLFAEEVTIQPAEVAKTPVSENKATNQPFSPKFNPDAVSATPTNKITSVIPWILGVVVLLGSFWFLLALRQRNKIKAKP